MICYKDKANTNEIPVKPEISLKNIFNSNEFSDFKFICSDGKEIPVHAVILATNSSVMNTMLTTTMSETGNRHVKLNDIDGETMLELLRFIYTQEVQNIKNLASKLLYGAEKYDLEYLKKLCIESLTEHLTPKNVIDCLILADRYRSEDLLEKCTSLIDLYVETFNHSNGMKYSQY